MQLKRRPWVKDRLIIELSMDSVQGLYGALLLSLPDEAMARNALRQSIEQASFAVDDQAGLWQGALANLNATCGASTASAFQTWAEGFPCDPADDLQDLAAWERVWPEVANRLRSLAPRESWAAPVADAYWSMTDVGTYSSSLERALEKPLSDWDKRCFAAFGGDDLLSEAGFFHVTTKGAVRQELIAFWRVTSRDLESRAKDIIWHEGRTVWAEEHGEVGPQDLNAMRSAMTSDDDYAWALDFMKKSPVATRPLPHPDAILAAREGTGHAVG